jgi:acetyl esterase/lipase
MPSQASREIRATFSKAAAPDDRPLAEQRRAWEEDALREPLPPDVSVTPILIHGVHCELIQNPRCNASQLLIFLHGGGFTSGSCKTHRHLAAQLAQASLLPILLVDYPLAPEHPFPAAVNDTVGVYQALLASGRAPSQLVVGGDSAGGGLAMSVLLALRAANIPQPAAAVLISPWADLTMSGESIGSRADLEPLTLPSELFACASQYIGTGDPGDPLASAVFADLAGLPPLMIHVGDHELLLSDSVRLAENARAAGVEVELVVWEEMWHVFPAWAPALPEGQAALEQIGEFVQRRLA